MKLKKTAKFLLTCVLLGLSFAALSNKLNIDLSKTSVSGLSSGGYMASQFQLSHADKLLGAGIVAAGPYYCAQNSLSVALGECVNVTTDALSLDTLNAYVRAQQALENLAASKDIAAQKTMLLHGTLDDKINRKAATMLVQQMQTLGMNELVFVSDTAFAHLFPSLSQGSDCSISASPYIGNCGFDAAGLILEHIYGKLAPRTKALKQNLLSFDQAKLSDRDDADMADEGFVYLPENCQNGESCAVHISFHGCNQSREDVGDAYAWQTGFNDWAEANNLIVLYPQVKKSRMFPINPQGCWDWWGYTGDEYATKAGKQVSAMYNMLQNLSNKNIEDL